MQFLGNLAVNNEETQPAIWNKCSEYYWKYWKGNTVQQDPNIMHYVRTVPSRAHGLYMSSEEFLLPHY
jgi:hypothetical protein